MVHDLAQIEALAEEVRYTGSEPLAVHVKVDTGMGRLGAHAARGPGDRRGAVARFREVRLEG